MKPKPSELWQRLVSEATPQTTPPTDTEVDHIVSRLRWQLATATPPTWDTLLWPLLSRIALPGAVALLLIAAFFPAPPPTRAADSVDDLIASATQLP